MVTVACLPTMGPCTLFPTKASRRHLFNMKTPHPHEDRPSPQGCRSCCWSSRTRSWVPPPAWWEQSNQAHSSSSSYPASSLRVPRLISLCVHEPVHAHLSQVLLRRRTWVFCSAPQGIEGVVGSEEVKNQHEIQGDAGFQGIPGHSRASSWVPMGL